MRIIAGTWRGKPLFSPQDQSIRPTSDRTREAIFNLLMHRFDDNPVIDRHVLDLCCGCGALGLEALSRGARFVTFIDQSRTATTLTERNVRALGAVAQARIMQSNATALPSAAEPVSLVLMDPPYYSTLIADSFPALRAQGWIAKGTILVYEQSRRESFPELEGIEILTQRHYGKAQITLVEVA